MAALSRAAQPAVSHFITVSSRIYRTWNVLYDYQLTTNVAKCTTSSPLCQRTPAVLRRRLSPIRLTDIHAAGMMGINSLTLALAVLPPEQIALAAQEATVMFRIAFVKQHKIISIILAYFLVGLIYGLTGYLQNMILGKQIVFSPLIGIPISMVFWPAFVYADLRNIGVRLHDLMAFAAIIVSIVILLKNWKG